MSEERYVDPNSGAAPQPGGYASGAPTAVPDDNGNFDAAVADEVTEAQESENDDAKNENDDDEKDDNDDDSKLKSAVRRAAGKGRASKK